MGPRHMTTDIEKLEDSPHLLDLLIQMEDILDTFDIYVFKNWFEGELIEGPKVRRYWLDMTLRYPHSKMPDPRGGLRLLKHGVRVDYTKIGDDEESEDQTTEAEGAEEKGEPEWHVRISIPRRLVVEANAGQLDFYDEEVDVEDVQDANDKGMNDETGYMDGDEGGIEAPADNLADDADENDEELPK